MTKPRKNARLTYTDPETGKFIPGNPGRPRGSRHKTSLAIEGLLDGQAEALGERAIQLALSGDTVALRLCLDRILPRRRDAPVDFPLSVESVRDAVSAARAVLLAVADSTLSPEEGNTIMAMVERFGRVAQLAEFDDRIRALEMATSEDAK